MPVYRFTNLPLIDDNIWTTINELDVDFHWLLSSCLDKSLALEANASLATVFD